MNFTFAAGHGQRERLSLPAAAGELSRISPGLIMVALALLWAAHDGGFDADTWYWGALVLLATLTVTTVLVAPTRAVRSRGCRLALAALSAYVAWSYASILWAQAPGTALQGSNRALLYLIVFALMTAVPWRPGTARALLVFFALGVGGIGVVILMRLASADQLPGLITFGRLEAPTGYFNSTAALLTMGALVATALAVTRELPGLLRGLLLAAASASLQLAVAAQSRGWLLTLPLVLILALAIFPQRLRFAFGGLLPLGATAISAPHIVAIYNHPTGHALTSSAQAAGREALLLSFLVFVLGTLIAWADSLVKPPPLSKTRRRTAGILLAAVLAAGGTVGALTATHGDPSGFISRQWQGFSHPQTSHAQGSHFATVGSTRYDFWRVGLQAFASHPLGGLGQDNFDDYYVRHRRTDQEPLWTHSLELRLLVHTGIIGFLAFAVFLCASMAVALRVRRRGPPAVQLVASVALLPLVVWLIHGSVDWFWEVPALTAPALGFLGMANRLAEVQPDPPTHRYSRRPRRALVVATMAASLVGATLVLTLPYLSVREVSIASDLGGSDPAAALHDLKVAAQLNPLSADAETRAGLLALSNGENAVAELRFAQSIQREPDAWLPWLGTGLAQSAMGQRQTAVRAFRRAYAINNRQPPIKLALRRVFTGHPLTYVQAVPMFTIAR